MVAWGTPPQGRTPQALGVAHPRTPSPLLAMALLAERLPPSARAVDRLQPRETTPRHSGWMSLRARRATHLEPPRAAPRRPGEWGPAEQMVLREPLLARPGRRAPEARRRPDPPAD